MKTSNFSRNQVSDPRFLVDSKNFTGVNWLISISDTDTRGAQIKLPMNKTLHMRFNDISLPFEGAISDYQASSLAQFIQQAKAANANLWVNCHAGVSRSGAIVEILQYLGWEIQEEIRSRRRVPNALVYEKLRKLFPNVPIPPMQPLAEYLEDDRQVIYP